MSLQNLFIMLSYLFVIQSQIINFVLKISLLTSSYKHLFVFAAKKGKQSTKYQAREIFLYGSHISFLLLILTL